MMYAIDTEPSTMAGISRSRKSWIRSGGDRQQNAHFTPRKYWQRKPVTKVGTEMSSRETIRMTVSHHLPFFSRR